MDQNKHQSSIFFLVIDILMLLLIVTNLSWIFFDALFESQSFRNGVQWFSPQFHDFYIPIHEDFLRYDLMFVSIYIGEFFIRWIKSVFDRDYSKWYFFPLAHWYDLVGCIPIGALHTLRILRVIVILRKLQDIGIIRWQDTFLIRAYQKYITIVTEEISDRVVVQVLDGMSNELRQGTPVLHQITEKALVPRSEALSQWLSDSITHLIHDTYDIRKVELQQQINRMVSHAASQTQDLKRIKQIPLLGDHIGDQIERTVASMVFDISDQIIEYLRSDLSTEIMSEAVRTIISRLEDPNSDANHLVQEILLDTIDVLKAQVLIQQWKTTYA